MLFVLASTRSDIASYVQAVFTVYIVLIFIYILTNWMFSFGVRLPYHRFSDAIINFLRDVCEPYLRLYRRLIPPIGMIDITPIIAIIVLYVVEQLVVSAIQG
jgi:YggT family protein